MRPLEPSLTPELAGHVSDMPVWRAPAFKMKSYRELVEHVARLSYANPNQLLFFRGQARTSRARLGEARCTLPFIAVITCHAVNLSTASSNLTQLLGF